MKRRDFLQAGLVAGASVLGASQSTAAEASRPVVSKGVVEANIADLQALMVSGKLTAKRLTADYLARIKAIDKSGPRINAVIELNPDALMIAAELDRERKQRGPRGPMHGIPVLLKDNIATLDKMQTTAGSIALVGQKPIRDAFVAQQLRAAGAVILGKTNLSEWANMRSTRSTSGWSSRGGLTRNPYALDRNTSGSSSGSGAAIAASLAAVAVGTETDGSIVSPSNANGLVGIKPTLGLVSRNGIIPIAHSQDTAGPMARCVADAAALLSALAGVDARDPATKDAARYALDFTRFLEIDGLKGKRLGVVRSQFGGRNDLASAQVEQALLAMKAAGAELIELAEMPGANKYGATELEVLLYELKADLAAYFADLTPGGKIATLADLIAFNEQHQAKVMPHFAQEHFIRAQTKGGLDDRVYLDALANNLKFSRDEGIDQALRENKLDALVAPSGSPAWLTDYIRGDNGGGGFASAAAVSGYPHITVPAGFVQGLPCGVSFVGAAWSEPKLIAIAYAFEQATKHRRAPGYVKTVNNW